MAKVIILPLPAYGHVNPTLPLAQELVTRGEEVCYCLPDQFKHTVASAGVRCLPYQLTGRGLHWRRLSCEELFCWLPLHVAASSLEILPQLLEIVCAEQPDYLIYDACCLWGRLAARIVHLPAIRFHTSFVINERLGPVFERLLEQAERASMPRMADGPLAAGESPITFRSVVEYLCSTYNVPLIELKSFFDHAEPLTLVPIPRAFQPEGETFDNRFQFVGPSLLTHDQDSDFPLDRLNKQSTLYISLGTVCNDEDAFYKMCFAAFGEGSRATDGKRPFSGRGVQTEPAWQVVLSSKSGLSTLGLHPENFLVRPHVPQLAVLQRSSVFVTHGGMNSVMEALSYGVPMVVIPQMLEQSITAQRVEELGLGIALDRNAITADRLQEAVRRVASEPQFRTRVQQMREVICQSGGARSATEAIIHFTRTSGQRGWSWTPRPGHG